MDVTILKVACWAEKRERLLEATSSKICCVEIHSVPRQQQELEVAKGSRLTQRITMPAEFDLQGMNIGNVEAELEATEKEARSRD